MTRKKDIKIQAVSLERKSIKRFEDFYGKGKVSKRINELIEEDIDSKIGNNEPIIITEYRKRIGLINSELHESQKFCKEFQEKEAGMIREIVFLHKEMEKVRAEKPKKK